ncbi:hypothetical protein M9H77_31388 [Catharanthus roseus]|uniref:Uncharacterized protein n=1 Tax=Catharanthus roseus TaxID=4058 RepID=A0ACC0A0W6_CATRO|nr:hypothetical protein M9H77_31388 [Catharanthus roseus]
MRVPSFYEEYHMFYFTLYSMNNDNEMCYLWTIRPNIAKEGIHVLVEFIPSQPQTVSISHDTNTYSFYEPSMFYLTVDEDDDENDHSDEDYTVSSKSDDDYNTDVKKEGIQKTLNPVISNTVTQWYSSQWFNSATYDYTQFGAFLDMGSREQIDDLSNQALENGTRSDAYVPEIYSQETYRRTYQSNFYPVGHEDFWRDTPYNLTFYPPNMNNQQGRK